MIKAPIWKETIYETTGDTLHFVVKVGDDTIWDDVAYRYPDEARIKIYMNRIAVDFMEGNLAFVTGLTANPKEYMEFKLYKQVGGVLTLLETYAFLFCFTGEWNGGAKILSNPVNGVLDPRMLAPLTAYSGGTASPDWYLIFNTDSYTVPADIEEGTEYSFYVTDTNLPYSGSTSGKLTGGDWSPGIRSTHTFYGLGGPEDMFVMYEYGGWLHTMYDSTQLDGRVYFKLKPNTTGEVRQLKTNFVLETTNETIRTITITQLG